MVGAKLANMRQGERTDVEPSANLPKVSQEQAAELVNVSTRSVTAAAKVEAEVCRSWCGLFISAPAAAGIHGCNEPLTFRGVLTLC